MIRTSVLITSNISLLLIQDRRTAKWIDTIGIPNEKAASQDEYKKILNVYRCTSPTRLSNNNMYFTLNRFHSEKRKCIVLVSLRIYVCSSVSSLFKSHVRCSMTLACFTRRSIHVISANSLADPPAIQRDLRMYYTYTKQLHSYRNFQKASAHQRQVLRTVRDLQRPTALCNALCHRDCRLQMQSGG